MRIPDKMCEECTRCYEIVKNMEKIFNNNYFSWYDNPLSRRLIGLAMTLVPESSFVGGSKLCIMVLFSFLNHDGMKVKLKIIPSIGPSKTP